MNKTFIFNDTDPTPIEVLSGIFYDRDLDPAYSGEISIDERLSLITTRDYVENLSGNFNGINIFLKNGNTVFNQNSPITGISSNTASVLLTPTCQVGTTNYFTLSTIDSNDITAAKYSYKEMYYDIQAKDSIGSTSSKLYLYLRAKNPVCTFNFTVANYNVDGEGSVIPSGGAVNVDEVGDYFTLTFSNIKNTQDGDGWLEDLKIEEIAEYIKLKHPDGTFDLEIPYFEVSLVTGSSQSDIVLKYTLTDVFGAQSLGAFPLIPYMYNTMGVNEFVSFNAGTTSAINNRSKDITSSYTLTVAAVALDLIPYTNTNSSLQVAGEGCPGIPLDYSISENTGYGYDHKFPFTIEADEEAGYSYTIKAKLEPNGGKSGIEERSMLCILSKSPYTYTHGNYQSLNIYNDVEVDFDEMVSQTLRGYVRVHIPQYWSGGFTLTITATILGQGIGSSGTVPTGFDSATWKVIVNDVNQSPTWAEGFDDYGEAPAGTDEV